MCVSVILFACVYNSILPVQQLTLLGIQQHDKSTQELYISRLEKRLIHVLECLALDQYMSLCDCLQQAHPLWFN